LRLPVVDWPIVALIRVWRSVLSQGSFIDDERSGNGLAADAGEVSDLHPHGEVALIVTVAGGAVRAKELYVGRVLFAGLGGCQRYVR